MSNNQEKLNEQLFNVIADEKASDEAKLKKVRYLMRLGADVNARLYGKSVLSKAIEQNAGVEVVEFLREKGANEWVIPKEEALELSKGFWNDKGNLKSQEEIKELLKKGADVEARDKYGETALIKAAWCGHIEEVKYLVENGADVNAKCEDKNGRTALMKAAFLGELDVVKFLVEHGADVNEQDNNGETALMWAVCRGNLELCSYLIENGADVNVRKFYGATALDIARIWGKDDCVKFLEELQQKEKGNWKIWQRIFGGRD